MNNSTGSDLGRGTYEVHAVHALSRCFCTQVQTCTSPSRRKQLKGPHSRQPQLLRPFALEIPSGHNSAQRFWTLSSLCLFLSLVLLMARLYTMMTVHNRILVDQLLSNTTHGRKVNMSTMVTIRPDYGRAPRNSLTLSVQPVPLLLLPYADTD